MKLIPKAIRVSDLQTLEERGKNKVSTHQNMVIYEKV